MNYSKVKMNGIIWLSLLGSFNLSMLYSFPQPIPEIIMLLIFAALFLSYSCLPFILTKSVERGYLARISFSILLQSAATVLLII